MADEETTTQTEETQQEESSTQQTEDNQEQTADTSNDDTQAQDADTNDQGSTDESSSEASEDTASSEESGEQDGEDVEIPEKFQNIVSEIENMSVLDLNELVKLLETKFGVSAAAAAAPATAGGEAGAEEEEKSTYTVELTDVGDEKIGVIKVVKNVLGLGLKEAKDMAENLPATLKEDMPKDDAEDLKSQVEEAGGSIELK